MLTWQTRSADTSLVVQYDRAGQGALSFEDMVNVIQDLGLLVSHAQSILQILV